MAVRNFKNFAVGTLGASLGSGATSGTLTTGVGAKMPAVPFDLVIWGAAFASPDLDSTAEIVTVTALTGDAIGTMVRAQENTSTKAWASGDKVLATVSARALNIDRVIPVYVGAGLTGQSATSATSIMPGGAAYSFPANTFGVGDHLRVSMMGARRGSQNTQTINYELFWNGVSMYGGTLSATTFSPTWFIDLRMGIVGTTSQAASSASQAGANINADNKLFAADITTAITLDLKASFGATALDTFGLESLSITLHRAG